MRCLRWVTDMQAMHPKSPHVSGRMARCPRSESRAPLAACPAEHASVPHSNASMKPAPCGSRETHSGHTSVHDRAGIKRNASRAPPVRRLFNLLFKRGQTPAKNRTPPPLPYLLHHFVHSYNGLRRVVIPHPSRLGSSLIHLPPLA